MTIKIGKTSLNHGLPRETRLNRMVEIVETCMERSCELNGKQHLQSLDLINLLDALKCLQFELEAENV